MKLTITKVDGDSRTWTTTQPSGFNKMQRQEIDHFRASNPLRSEHEMDTSEPAPVAKPRTLPVSAQRYVDAVTASQVIIAKLNEKLTAARDDAIYLGSSGHVDSVMTAVVDQLPCGISRAEVEKIRADMLSRIPNA